WVTALGGAAGAGLLLTTPPQAFEAVAPWLIAGASLLLLRPPRPGGPRERNGPDGSGAPAGSGGRGTVSGNGGSGGGGGGHAAERGWAARAALFAVAVYVGYFGAAGGILMFAVLSAVLRQSAVKVNAVKNVVSALANAVAALGFALFGPVEWAAAVPLAAGFLAGGWIGPAIARRLPAVAPVRRRRLRSCGRGQAGGGDLPGLRPRNGHRAPVRIEWPFPYISAHRKS
ncbi:TSUP family transporter, partial [Planomonospora algeriensis]